MTTKKGFKRAVRRRMTKTGERYAAARRSLLAENTPIVSTREEPPTATPGGYRLRGGLHPETASLANVLAARGVTSPLTGVPLTEAMILGIGGGLGAGYILWEFKARKGAILVLGFRNQWQYPGIPGWTGKTLERLGVQAEVYDTAGVRTAGATLERIVAGGEPVIAIVDQQSIGTWGQPDELSGIWGYPVVVCGRREDGTYLVDDRGRAALEVAPAVMAAARARIVSYKHRLIHLRPGGGPLREDVLYAAIRAGLDDQVAHLRSPSDSFSLAAWRKWARLMTDTRNGKAWPRVFAGGRGLFGTLLSLVEGVDANIGATGGHLRALYAEFLDEAATALDQPALGGAAERWRAAADLWEDLADAAFPGDLEDGLAALELSEELNDAVFAGEPGRSRVRAATTRLWAIRDRHDDGVSMSAVGIQALFEDLGNRLSAIHAAEIAALEATASAVGR